MSDKTEGQVSSTTNVVDLNDNYIERRQTSAIGILSPLSRLAGELAARAHHQHEQAVIQKERQRIERRNPEISNLLLEAKTYFRYPTTMR